VKFEIGNWEKHKDVNALSNFKFRISSFDTGIKFDNTLFFRKSVNWRMKDANKLMSFLPSSSLLVDHITRYARSSRLEYNKKSY